MGGVRQNAQTYAVAVLVVDRPGDPQVVFNLGLNCGILRLRNCPIPPRPKKFNGFYPEIRRG